MADNKRTSPENSKRAKRQPRPYNHYNLYFILERELFLQQRGVFPSTVQITPDAEALRSQQGSSQSLASIVEPQQVNYNNIDVPTFPSRYSSLLLPEDWFVHKKKKRAHVKSHGLVSFREMAAMIASRWKEEEDQEIVRFVKTIVQNIKQRIDKMKGPLHRGEVQVYSTTSIEQNSAQVPAQVQASLTQMAPQVLQVSNPINQDELHKMRMCPAVYGKHGGLRHCVSVNESAASTGSISSSGSQASIAMKSQVDISDDEIMVMWHSQ